MVQNDFYDQSNVYNLYGYILHKLNKDDEALVFFRKALDLKEQGNISSVMNSYLGYAEILMEHHQYDRAVRMLKAGIELSYQQANAIYRSDLLKALSRCYEEDGMLVEALKYISSISWKQIAYIMRKRNVLWGRYVQNTIWNGRKTR